MELAAKNRISRPHDGTVSAAKRFGRYKKEGEKAVRELEAVKDGKVMQLTDLYVDCDLDPRKRPSAFAAVWGDERTAESIFYEEVLDKVRGHDHSAADIENFSIAMKMFEYGTHFGSKAGLMLSALVNAGRDERYVVHTAHLEETIRYLGFRNVKHLTIEGLATLVGIESAGGEIHVNTDDPSAFDWRAMTIRGHGCRSKVYLNGEPMDRR